LSGAKGGFAMETSPVSSLKEEGVRLLKAGKISEAIEKLQQALALDPEDGQIHCYLGAAYNAMPDKLHAIHHFEECVRLEESPKAYYNLGLVYESVHRVDEAVRQYRMALELDPNYTKAREALEKLHERFEAQKKKQSTTT
jgi:tetratricopeptide (TPR) repeat protein